MTTRILASEVSAMFYLNYSGSDIEEWEFMQDIHDSRSYLFHIGSGLVPLTIAIIADSEEDAEEAIHEWLRNTRPDELDEEGEMPEHVTIDRIVVG